MEQKIRLNKYLAERLGISRRQADDAIAAGKVEVNGRTAQLGDRVDFSDEVCYNGKTRAFSGGKVPEKADYLYVGMNKPVGYVCSRKRQGETPTIFELLPAEWQKLKTVGRLDKDSSGLILLTNDGDFAFKMTHPSFKKEKVYEVELDKPLAALHQQAIGEFGVEIGDGISRLGLARMNDRRDEDARKPGALLADGSRRFWYVSMSEGRNRQIRRTFEALGYEVKSLHRIKFGPYLLNGLSVGESELVKKVQ